MQNKPILVIGGTGKTGGRVVERLKKNNMSYHLGTPTSEIPFDWYNEATWATALRGIKSVYTVFYPDLAVPGAADIIKKFTEAAKAADIEHIVLLSGRGEKAAHESEQLVIHSGIAWTVVRCSWFMQNFSENFLLDDIMRREVALPVDSNISEPFVDADDIADVVFASLTQPDHRGQLYELTGPELLTFQEAVKRISTAIDTPIAYVKVSYQDYEQGMSQAGLPQPTIDLMDYLFHEVLDGRNMKLTDGVKRALGREPGNFDDYVSRTAKQGTWS